MCYSQRLFITYLLHSPYHFYLPSCFVSLNSTFPSFMMTSFKSKLSTLICSKSFYNPFILLLYPFFLLYRIMPRNREMCHAISSLTNKQNHTSCHPIPPLDRKKSVYTVVFIHCFYMSHVSGNESGFSLHPFYETYRQGHQ